MQSEILSKKFLAAYDEIPAFKKREGLEGSSRASHKVTINEEEPYRVLQFLTEKTGFKNCSEFLKFLLSGNALSHMKEEHRKNISAERKVDRLIKAEKLSRRERKFMKERFDRSATRFLEVSYRLGARNPVHAVGKYVTKRRFERKPILKPPVMTRADVPQRECTILVFQVGWYDLIVATKTF